LLRFSCVAHRRWRRRSLRFARHMAASLIASLLLRCKRRVPVAPSVPSLRLSHDGVAHCFASLALQMACACGAVGPLRFACHMTASLIASLLLRCKRRVPVAPSVPSLRLSHDGVAHCFASPALRRRVPVAPLVPSLRSSHDGVAQCFASLVLHTACACGAVGPFASLVTRRRRTLPRFSALQTACAGGAVGPFASLVT